MRIKKTDNIIVTANAGWNTFCRGACFHCVNLTDLYNQCKDGFNDGKDFDGMVITNQRTGEIIAYYIHKGKKQNYVFQRIHYAVIDEENQPGPNV